MTAGSVDDGKSTLIGRLLYEADGIFEDQLASIRELCARRNKAPDFSLITDALRSEREQLITIDVGYRYFSTPRRKFIIADVPGHEQHTSNMVTGASLADVAILLVDARKRILEQTKRHTYIAILLGIQHLVFAINKMDLVGFERSVFQELRTECFQLAARVNGVSVYCIPVCATEGDNVVHLSDRTAWYSGPPLLSLLETVRVREARNSEDFRFPIQNVVRPNQEFRGYAGRVVSGIIRRGEEVVALPSMQNTLVDRILFHPTELCDACAPLSVVLTLRDSLDLGRGTMLAGVRHCPAVTKDFTAKLIWMSKTRLELNRPYLVRHTTQTVCGYVIRLLSKIDITSLEDHPGDTLLFNEIGTVEVETNKAIFCDPYFDNRVTGSFILIDPLSADTLAAGIIVETDPRVSTLDRGFRRAAILTTSNQVIGGLTVWLTGLSGSGKSSIARAVHTELLSQGIRAELLDSDDLRRTLNSDLGFSKRDRDENVRRIGFIATLLARNGIVALVSAISPYRSTREEVRQLTRAFLEVFVDAPFEICEQRDPKGLYKQARAGEIQGFTGIDDPYEKPLQPDVHCFTDKENLRLSTDKVLSAVLKYIDRI